MNWKQTQATAFVLAALLICSRAPLYSQNEQAGFVAGPQQEVGVYGNALQNAINSAGKVLDAAKSRGLTNASAPISPSTPAPARRPNAALPNTALPNTAQQAGNIGNQIQGELQQQVQQQIGNDTGLETTNPRTVGQAIPGSSTRGVSQFGTAPGNTFDTGQTEVGQFDGGTNVGVGGVQGNYIGQGTLPTNNGVVDGSYGNGTTNIGPAIGQPTVVNGGFVAGPTPGGQVFSAPVAQGGVAQGVITQGSVAGPIVQGPNTAFAADAPIAPPVFGGNAGPQVVYVPVVQGIGHHVLQKGKAVTSSVGRIFGRVLNPRGNAANRVFGLGFLSLGGRDFDDDNVILAQDNLNPSRVLGTADADINNFGGIEGTFAQRNASGTGIEARYFGLFEDDAVATLPRFQNSPRLVGLNSINTGAGTAATVFSVDGTQSVARQARISNFELNRLKRGNGRFLGRATSVCDHYYGLRVFNFDEELNYNNTFNNRFNGAGSANYRVNVDNALVGLQTGQRVEMPLFGRLGLAFGGRFGAFNNRVRTQQSLTTIYPSGRTMSTAFDISDKKHNLAFLGEFNLGLTYQFRPTSRARFGYRALGARELALADRQIPADFNDLTVANFADTDGDFILQGGYFGFEWVR